MIDQLVDFLSMVAGARKDALVQAPRGRSQAATLGVVMILISIAAAFTFGYAIHRALLGDGPEPALAVGGGFMWGCLVFCLDRLLILGIDKFGGPWRLAKQVLVRLPLAVLVAGSISIPILLRVSGSVIDADLMKQRHQTTEEEFTANNQELGVGERENTLTNLKTSRAQQQERLRQEPDSWSYRAAKEKSQRLEAEYRRLSAGNGQRIAEANSGINQIRLAARDRELTAAETTRLEALRNRIETLRRETIQAQAAMTTAQRDEEETVREWMETQTTALDRLDKDIAASQADLNEIGRLLAARNAEANKQVSRIMAPNLVNQWRTLWRITADPKHPDAMALRTFEAVLHLFFLALELTPVFLKVLTKKTSLDYATAAVEFLDEERINLSANTEAARRQKLAEIAMAIEAAALDRWRDDYLKKIQASTISAADLKKLREEVEDIAA